MINFETLTAHEMAVYEQIDILYDMEILKYRNKGRTKPDPRAEYVYKILDACDTDYQMIVILHDVKAGNETLNDMLKRKLTKKEEL